MSKIKVTPTIIAGWLLTLGMVIAAVLPVLPPDTPTWVHQTLAIVAVIIAAVLQSARKIPPTEAEAVAALEGATPIAIVRVGGSAVVTVPDVPRETLPPAEPQ